MKSFTFFTFNNFSIDDGGTIRMRGILNALAEKNQNVTLISNTKIYHNFNPSVKHIYLNNRVSKQFARLFQFTIALLPIGISRKIFKKFTAKIEKIIKQENLYNKSIIFFEYIDNSVAYFLKKQNIIKSYISDTHGIAPLEFLHKHSENLYEKFINYLKFIVSVKLDKKVILEANQKIFVSGSMKNYFEKNYPSIKSNNNMIIRDGVNSSLCKKNIDKRMVEIYKKQFLIDEKDNVILFAGTFKDMGGVINLLNAFNLLVKKKKRLNVKLILLGAGERYNNSINFVKKNHLEGKAFFAGRTVYSELKNYQELADIIICPDVQHPYSELVPHVKYFDSLSSGKIVINGSFASVLEINIDERFSINFKPSDDLDLVNKIEMVLDNLDSYKKKYKDNQKIVCTKFTYNQFLKELIED